MHISTDLSIHPSNLYFFSLDMFFENIDEINFKILNLNMLERVKINGNKQYYTDLDSANIT